MTEKSSIFSGQHKPDGTWVKDLKDKIGRQLFERFMVCGKPELRPASNGASKFVTVEVGDKTGAIELKIWQIPLPEGDKVLSWLEQGHVYAIEASVREYKGKVQLNMTWEKDHANRPWTCAPPSESKIGDYFAEDFQMVGECRSRASIEQMLDNVAEIIEDIGHPGYKSVLRAFFGDEEWRAKFAKWPAAKKKHHAYVGGILHHVTEMMSLGAVFAVDYKEINVDLLITGILLHDIGKLDEYQLGLQIAYNEEIGKIGHIVRAIEEINRVVRERAIKISEEDLSLLKHLILSHHGEVGLGYGSAVSPQTPEAVLLHQLDMLSAKVNGAYFEKFKND